MKKRILSLVMVAIMVAGLLVGCGGGSGNKKGGAKLTGEKIKVTAQLHGWGRDYLDNAAAEFTYQTGIEVTVEWDSLLSGNLNTILDNEEMITSDMYIAPNISEKELLNEGLIEDLTDFMNEAVEDEGGKSLNERMEQGVWQCVVDKEGNVKQGVVKLSHPNYGMVYNKKIMSYLAHDVLGWEEGHDYPINTKEMFDLVDALNKETAAGNNKELLTYTQDGKSYDVKAIAWSGSTGTLEFLFYPWFAQYIGLEKLEQYLLETGDEPGILKDQANYLVYQTICDLMGVTQDDNGNVYPANSIPNCVSYNHTASQGHFFLGKSLFLPGASWIYQEMKESIENEKDWGYMPIPWLSDDEGNPLTAEGVEMPKNEDGSYMNFTYSAGRTGDAVVIPISCQNKELVKKFIRFLTSSEYLPKLASDMNSPVAYECDYSKIENKTYWFEQVLHVNEVSKVASWFSTGKLATSMGFYKATGVAPYTQLSVGTYGNVLKMVDSATGEELADGAKTTGFPVSDSVYKYVNENFKAGLIVWNRDRLKEGIY